MNHAKALEKAKSRDRRVKIQAGGESGAEREAESFDRIHDRSLAPRAWHGPEGRTFLWLWPGQVGILRPYNACRTDLKIGHYISGAEGFFHAGPALARGFFGSACAAPVRFEADGVSVAAAL